jgi:hypothetical protein
MEAKRPSETLPLAEDIRRSLPPLILLAAVVLALQILKHSISPELFLEITRPIRFFG